MGRGWAAKSDVIIIIFSSTLFIYLFTYVFIYLAVLGLSCSTWISDFHCGTESLLVASCSIFSCGLWMLSCGIRGLVPWPGIKPESLHWECGVLATGPPGKANVLLHGSISPVGFWAWRRCFGESKFFLVTRKHQYGLVYLFLRLTLGCLFVACSRTEILSSAGILKRFFSRNSMYIREVWIRISGPGDAVLCVFKTFLF